jgi:hypothetical protein
MTFFCPGCWKIIPGDVKVCPKCGCDLAAAAARTYPEKLIGALHHPEPETRRRAAEILGDQGHRPAIGPLLARAREELREPRRDIFLLGALLRSARKLGAPAQDWQTLLDQANHRFLRQLVEDDHPRYRRP